MTESDPRFDLCVCGFPRWRHPTNEKDRLTLFHTTSPSSQPHHLFIETEENIVVMRRGKGGRFEKVTS